MRFEPAGMTDDPDIRMAQSVMDYIFRRLALDYLPYETRSELGIYTAEEWTSIGAGGAGGGSLGTPPPPRRRPRSTPQRSCSRRSRGPRPTHRCVCRAESRCAPQGPATSVSPAAA